MTRLKTYLKFMLVAGLAFGLCFGIGSGLVSLFGEADQPDTANSEEEKLERQDGERTNILILGVDARSGEEQSRSDTMMLVSIDPKLNKAAVISIPRDTRVTIKGNPDSKINAANFFGGPKLAVQTVEDLLDIKIDHYVTVDFNGFKDIIDTLGGVTVTVPQAMYTPTEDIDLKAGTQRLDGRQALGLVRYREYALGDIERAAQQQEFVKALAQEILQPATIAKLPKLVKQLNQYVETDVGITAMLRMASWAPGFNADSVVTQTLPGYFYDEHDEYGNLTKSEWIADSSKFANLIDNLFAGKTLAVVTDSPLPVSSPKAVVKDVQSSEKNENQDTSPDTQETNQGSDQNSGEDSDENTGENSGEDSGQDSQSSEPPGAGDGDEATEATYPAGNLNIGPEGYL